MKHPIDLEHWNRKEHFLFFGSMDDPFFGLTTQIDVTSIYKEAKADHASFFLYKEFCREKGSHPSYFLYISVLR